MVDILMFIKHSLRPYVRVWIVIDQIEILVRERKQVVDVGIDHHLRQGGFLSAVLLLDPHGSSTNEHPKRVHKLTGFNQQLEPSSRLECVRGNVEGTPRNVSALL